MFNLQSTIMKNTDYTSPALEVVELCVETAILAASGENATIDFGE